MMEHLLGSNRARIAREAKKLKPSECRHRGAASEPQALRGGRLWCRKLWQLPELRVFGSLPSLELLQCFGRQHRGAHSLLLFVRLRHAEQEVPGCFHRYICGHDEVPRLNVGLDPLRDFRALVLPRVALVGEDHDAVVLFRPDDTAQALGCLAHGIKVEELGLSDLVVLPQELQPRSKLPRESVLERHAKEHDTAAIVSIKVDTLGYFASGHAEEDGSMSGVTRLAVQVQRVGCGNHILRLNEDKLVLQDPCDDARAVPLLDNLLQVAVRREETNEAVRHRLNEPLEQVAVVVHDAGVLAQAEARGHRHLVRAVGHNERAEALPVHGDGEGLCHHNICHAQDLGVHL
mmetsp:Transcript_58760/g.136716  ORF Transcript_58760/g.136716 Transcript_58760/m.136716 type:complete len:347 (-) Transcript_58760:1013-2053(-)